MGVFDGKVMEVLVDLVECDLINAGHVGRILGDKHKVRASLISCRIGESLSISPLPPNAGTNGLKKKNKKKIRNKIRNKINK